VLVAIAVGLAVKTPTFPFHTWLPPAHTDAPAAGSAVLAAANPKMTAWLTLGLYAGLRSHEIAKIQGQDVQQDKLWVFGKGAKGAFVPTHPRIWDLAQSMPRQGWWFPSRVAGGHVSSMTISTLTTRLFSAQGITGSGGKLPYFDSASGIDEAFKAAIVAPGLKAGDLLKPVKSAFGWHTWRSATPSAVTRSACWRRDVAHLPRPATGHPTSIRSPSQRKGQVMNKKVTTIVIAGAFLVGGGFGSASSQATPVKTAAPVTVTKTVQGPERVVTKTVTKTVTPQSCLDALDMADKGFGYGAAAISAASDGFKAVSTLDVPGMTAATTRMTTAGDSLGALAPDYNAAKAACRAN